MNPFGAVPISSKPRRSQSGAIVLFPSLVLLLLLGAVVKADSYAGKFVITNLDRPASDIQNRDPHIDYKIDPIKEQFFTYVPAQYTDSQRYGLIIFINSDNHMNDLPPGWIDFLEKRKLIFISPMSAGDQVPAPRRLGLALYAALGAPLHWNIDPSRVYVAGFSGGAQIAEDMEFFAPDIFTGAIPICGANAYKPLPTTSAAPKEKLPDDAGLLDATPAEINAARQKVRFAFVTGENDSCAPEIRDIASLDFERQGFHSILIQVPHMDHALCPPKRLNEAIDFIENVKLIPTTQPTPPAWMARDHNDWPQILLRNKVDYSDNTEGFTGSSSLIRLPSGVVVLGTARHLLDGMKLSDFASKVRSWTAYPNGSRQAGVRMPLVAMDTVNPPSIDALVLCPASQYQDWPSTILPIRQHPLEIGDTVYLIAEPNGGHTRQNVYPGIIVEKEGGEWIYNVDEVFDHEGMSGSPMIDEYGQLAAINVGHLLEQKIPGKLQLTCIDATDVMQAIKLPPGVHPLAGSASAPAAPSSPALLNQQADAALRGARVFISNQMYGAARAKLQNLIKFYPNTPATETARELLSELPGQ